MLRAAKFEFKCNKLLSKYIYPIVNKAPTFYFQISNRKEKHYVEEIPKTLLPGAKQ
jgi:hypothetical protein